ncbi:MAG: 3-deoxy-manno-octulosonate cytidylyltransferase [Alphaproteobacteria bacterium]
MNTVIVIPVRLASKRFPNKPLEIVNGKPMILHVWEKAVASNIGPVCVACCDEEIFVLIKEKGGNAVMTDTNAPSGTDRIWEALINDTALSDCDTIINLQGDLPTITTGILHAALNPLKNNNIDIGTIACQMSLKDPDVLLPNSVKIALSFYSENMGRALYFSRAPIPYKSTCYYHHIGIYAYRRSALEKFVAFNPSPLELTERLEQLRALEMNLRIGVQIVNTFIQSVDTKEDLERLVF